MTKKTKTPSTARQRIMDLLHDNPNGMTSRELRSALSISEPVVSDALSMLKNDGFIRCTVQPNGYRRYHLITGDVPTFGINPMIAMFNNCLAEVRA